MSEQADYGYISDDNLEGLKRPRLDIVREHVHQPKPEIEQQLRDYQIPHYRSGLRFIEAALTDDEASRAGYYGLPTGYGKTNLNIALAQGAGIGSPSIPPDERPRGILFVPTRHLREQSLGDDTEEERLRGFAKYAPEIRAVKAQDVGSTTGHIDMVVSTYQYALKAYERGEFTPGQFELFFHDESHTGLGLLTGRMMRELGRSSLHIGYTATPEFGNLRHVKGAFPTEIGSMSLLDGILKHKFLAGTQLFALQSEIGRTGWDPDQPHGLMERLISDKQRNSQIVKAALEGLEVTNGKVLIKGVRGGHQLHARILADALNGQPHPSKNRPIVARAIGSSIAGSAEGLTTFSETEEIDVLVTVKMGLLGTDIKDLKCMVHGAPTQYYSELAQDFGRGTRPKSDGSLFRFYQIIDLEDRQAKIWKLLGFNDRPPNGSIIAPGSASSWTDTSQRRVSEGAVSYFNEQDNVVSEIGTVKQAASPEEAMGRITLKEIAERSGLSPSGAQDVLAKMGYGFLASTEGHLLEQTYEAEALPELHLAAASSEAATVVNVTQKLGINKPFMEKALAALGIEPPVLYFGNHQVNGKSRLFQTLQPHHIKAIKNYIEEIRLAFDPETQLPLKAICTMTGKNKSALNVYLTDRHFQAAHVTIPGSNRSVLVYNKEEILSWWSLYSAAQPLKKDGVVVFQQEEGYSLHELTLAAKQIGVPIAYGKVKDTVVDYVPVAIFGAVRQEADRIREEAQREFPLSELVGDLGLTEEEFTAYLQSPQKHHLASAADAPIVGRQRGLLTKSIDEFLDDYHDADRKQELQKKSDLDIVRQEPHLMAAILNIQLPRPAESTPAPKEPAVEPSPAPEPAPVPEPASEVKPIPKPPLKPRLRARSATIPIAKPVQQERLEVRATTSRPDTIRKIFTLEQAEQLASHLLLQLQGYGIRHLPSIEDSTGLVELHSVSMATKQPASVLISYIKSSHLFRDGQLGLSDKNRIVCDRETSKELLKILHEVPQIPANWTTMQNIADILHVNEDSINHWLGTIPASARGSHTRSMPLKGGRVAFLSPELTKRIIIEYHTARRTVLMPVR